MSEEGSIKHWFSGFIIIFLLSFLLYTLNRLFLGLKVSLLEIWGVLVILINLFSAFHIYTREKDS
jgi:hypothetical protein